MTVAAVDTAPGLAPGAVRPARTCTWGTPTGPCGADAQPYMDGYRCRDHSPVARLARTAAAKEATRMDPTPEQAEVIAAYGDGVDLTVQAGAGCGKSTTLKEVARSDPRARMLYIAYNKPIALDAAKSFPSNATCKTGHSLAYDARHQVRLSIPYQTAHVAAQALGVREILARDLGEDGRSTQAVMADDARVVAMTSKKVMRFALDAVRRWCYSADPEMTAAHIPRVDNLTRPDTREAIARLVLPVARAAWADLMQSDGVLRMEHDHYMKAWALGRPRLAADVVLLDEAQDTNDVLTAVLLDQDHAQRIAVGDSAQAIYAWRGANDALAKFPGDTLTLSQSFRFGVAVAEQANVWLNLISAPLRLIGHEPTASVVGPVDQADAILCRTNAGAVGVVIEALAAGRKVALVGGGGAIKSLAYAALDLLDGKPTDHPDLMGFTNWAQLQEYAAEEAGSLRVLVKLIDDFGAEAMISAAEALVTEQRADLVVSTAHKAKGREWSRVTLHGDFTPPRPDPSTGLRLLRREYARLAYVSVTRARHALDCAVLDWVHDGSIVITD
ncbi:UvrD-helicase domain-containing protein [Embleya hyalina]|uniref:DNA helicase n=1 Tax=Embleya hyalina TaxID=516124 RepID=A0A401YHI7_9ACTN|nr:UvrD-helicase domain-containing protein [Embleya hyalina]GCD94053.1 DNA helicase [Embleya hyalina]